MSLLTVLNCMLLINCLSYYLPTENVEDNMESKTGTTIVEAVFEMEDLEKEAETKLQEPHSEKKPGPEETVVEAKLVKDTILPDNTPSDTPVETESEVHKSEKRTGSSPPEPEEVNNEISESGGTLPEKPVGNDNAAVIETVMEEKTLEKSTDKIPEPNSLVDLTESFEFIENILEWTENQEISPKNPLLSEGNGSLLTSEEITEESLVAKQDHEVSTDCGALAGSVEKVLSTHQISA